MASFGHDSGDDPKSINLLGMYLDFSVAGISFWIRLVSISSCLWRKSRSVEPMGFLEATHRSPMVISGS